MARKPITGKEYMKGGKKNDNDADDKKKKGGSKMCMKCKDGGKMACKHMKKKGGLKLNPPSKGHAPKGAHGRAAVRALGRTKTTGNFSKIEKSKGRGAAISAYQNALASHKAGASKKKASGKEMLGRAMSKLSTKHYKHK